jgi:hypothetical protein
MGILNTIGTILDVAKPIIGIAGKVLGGSDKDNAGARTKAALSGKSKADAREKRHADFVTGFIDERADEKSKHNIPPAANDASKLLKIALAGDGDLSPEYKYSVERLISSLEQAQIRV